MSVFVYLIRIYFSIPTPGGTASGLERLVDIIIRSSLPKLREKLLEALQAVLPIAAIVLILCFSIAPVSPSILLCFLLGAAMIIVGIINTTKDKKAHPDRMETKKYCRFCKKHTTHKETK